MKGCLNFTNVLKGFCWLFHEHGYSAFELMVSMAILLTLVAKTTPQFVDMQTSFDRTRTQSLFDSDLRNTRAQALAHGARGVLEVASDGGSYTVGVDYLPFNDPAEADTTIVSRTIPEGINVTTEGTFVFNSRGYLIDGTGAPTTQSFYLMNGYYPYCMGTVSPIGSLSYYCREYDVYD